MLPPRIPRTLHSYWSGPLSYLRLMTLASFKVLHPDFYVVLYTSAHGDAPMRWPTGEQAIPYLGPDYRDELAAYVDETVTVGGPVRPANRMADLVRLDALHERGGVWSDLDIVWMRPLATLDLGAYVHPRGAPAETVSFASVFQDGAAGAMLAAPGTGYLAHVRTLAHAAADDGDYQAAGPAAFLRGGSAVTIGRDFPELVVADLPPVTFYPVTWDQPELLLRRPLDLPRETVGIHWFGGSRPMGQFCNDYATPAQLRAVRNTLTVALRELDLL